MSVTALKPAELVYGLSRERIGHGADRQSYKQLIGMQTGVVVS